ncbi:hypothetical protein CFIMG_007834RA00001 [Ceratocystis fimbriata CBS 114723]|uniref:Uncharacterized protein n=1 Tax=Ceratocystis fimbriata CBS 114723 TaxID=1035309 RepID=A0A2C5WUJ1_9PEZI|nr:hypothetical protein CFIMG_007834RA00001 [Ceratocystis fimbriata CBS 114723]
MTGDDTSLLVITSGVASQFENFGSEVLENGSEINRCTSTDTLSVVSLAKKTVYTTDREGQTSLGRTAIGIKVQNWNCIFNRLELLTTERSWSR